MLINDSYKESRKILPPPLTKAALEKLKAVVKRRLTADMPSEDYQQVKRQDGQGLPQEKKLPTTSQSSEFSSLSLVACAELEPRCSIFGSDMHLHTQLTKEPNKYVVEIENFNRKESAQEEKTCKGTVLYYSLSFLVIHL